VPRISSSIEIKGFKDLQRELRLVDARLPKELGDVNYDVAQYVIARSKGRASTPLENRAAGTLKAARQQKVSLVRLGGPRNPEALGAEFGAGHNTLRNTTRGVMEGWNQFRPWRGSGAGAGYFLFPTIREDTPQIIDMYYDLIDNLTRRAFPS
jgi:hypothetical protein